jgi:nitroreductase
MDKNVNLDVVDELAGVKINHDVDHKAIKDAIIISQHTQRNWDLSKEIPAADMDLLIHAATQCPSKQNIAYYKTHFITDRKLIEQIHAVTTFKSRHQKYKIMTNTQVLANLLIVFEKNDFIPSLWEDIPRSNETDAIIQGTQTEADMECLRRDAEMAVGIAAGYLNLTASLMDLRTGCCACFDPEAVQKILGMEREPLLLMGIGYRNANKNRRIHHFNKEVVFSSKIKQPISVKIYR